MPPMFSGHIFAPSQLLAVTSYLGLFVVVPLLHIGFAFMGWMMLSFVAAISGTASRLVCLPRYVSTFQTLRLHAPRLGDWAHVLCARQGNSLDGARSCSGGSLMRSALPMLELRFSCDPTAFLSSNLSPFPPGAARVLRGLSSLLRSVFRFTSRICCYRRVRIGLIALRKKKASTLDSPLLNSPATWRSRVLIGR